MFRGNEAWFGEVGDEFEEMVRGNWAERVDL